MKEITWKEMVDLKRAKFGPFRAVFILSDPVGDGGEKNIALTSLEVVRFKGDFPVVEYCGSEYVAIDAKKIYCEVV